MSVLEIDQFQLKGDEFQEHPFGLVDPKEVGVFIVPFENEKQLNSATVGFDELYRQTHDLGRIRFHGHSLSMSRYGQSGNLIRSFTIPNAGKYDDRVLNTVISLIELPDGLIIGEMHHSEHIGERGITEPPIGSPDIRPLKDANVNDFVRFVDESMQRTIDRAFWGIVLQQDIG